MRQNRGFKKGLKRLAMAFILMAVCFIADHFADNAAKDIGNVLEIIACLIGIIAILSGAFGMYDVLG